MQTVYIGYSTSVSHFQLFLKLFLLVFTFSSLHMLLCLDFVVLDVSLFPTLENENSQCTSVFILQVYVFQYIQTYSVHVSFFPKRLFLFHLLAIAVRYILYICQIPGSSFTIVLKILFALSCWIPFPGLHTFLFFGILPHSVGPLILQQLPKRCMKRI